MGKTLKQTTTPRDNELPLAGTCPLLRSLNEAILERRDVVPRSFESSGHRGSASLYGSPGRGVLLQSQLLEAAPPPQHVAFEGTHNVAESVALSTKPTRNGRM